MALPCLSQHQWQAVYGMSIEIQRAKSVDEIIYLVLTVFPKLLGINYTVWHQRSKTELLNPDKVHAQRDYKLGVIGCLDAINETIFTHPILTGLDMTDKIELPDKEVVTMLDFASERQVRETAIYREAYRHIEIKNHAVVEFWIDDDNGIMVCFNGERRFTEEQKFMIQMLKQHLALAYKRLSITEQNVHELPIVEKLSKRENEVLPHLLEGKSNPEIAIILGISTRTVEKHVSAILEKAGVENRKSLIATLKNG